MQKYLLIFIMNGKQKKVSIVRQACKGLGSDHTTKQKQNVEQLVDNQILNLSEYWDHSKALLLNVEKTNR